MGIEKMNILNDLVTPFTTPFSTPAQSKIPPRLSFGSRPFYPSFPYVYKATKTTIPHRAPSLGHYDLALLLLLIGESSL